MELSVVAANRGKQRVFITGAAGFLGLRLVQRLLESDVAVRCFVRPSSDVRELQGLKSTHGNDLEIVVGDLSDRGACVRQLKGCDVVFHLASQLRGPTAVLFMNNVVGTRALLEAVSAVQVQRFVLISSLGVYGTQDLGNGAVLDETCPLDPLPESRDAYTYSKIVQERVAWEAREATGLPLVVVRPGVIYGPGRSLLTDRVGLKLGGTVAKVGGKRRLPYTYVDNCAEAIALAGTASGVEGEAINIVDDDLPTPGMVIEHCKQGAGGIRVLPLPRWAVGPLSDLSERYHRWSEGQLPAILTRSRSSALWKPLTYDNSKAKRLLDWSPRISFNEALVRLSGAGN